MLKTSSFLLHARYSAICSESKASLRGGLCLFGLGFKKVVFFFKWARNCLFDRFGWCSPTPTGFQMGRRTQAPCSVELCSCSAPNLKDLCPLPLSSGQLGAYLIIFQPWELNPPEVIVLSPVHPSSVSSAPWGGLGWFLGAAVHYPSPSWLEEKEGEMGTRQNHIMLLAFQPAGKLPGKPRKGGGCKDLLARSFWMRFGYEGVGGCGGHSMERNRNGKRLPKTGSAG